MQEYTQNFESDDESSDVFGGSQTKIKVHFKKRTKAHVCDDFLATIEYQHVVEEKNKFLRHSVRFNNFKMTRKNDLRRTSEDFSQKDIKIGQPLQ